MGGKGWIGRRDQEITRMKIAFFHCAFVYSGGGERIALEGVLGLRKRGHTVDLFSPATDAEKCFPDLLKKAKPQPIIPQLPKGFALRDGLNMLLASILAPWVAYKFKDYDIFVGENQPGAWFAFLYSRLFRKPYIIYLNQPNRMVYPRAIDIKTGWSANKNFVFLQKVITVAMPFVSYLDKLSTVKSSCMAVNGTYIGDIISQIYGKEYVNCPAGCDPFPHGKLVFTKSNYYEGSLTVNGFTIKKPYVLLTNRHYPQKRFDYAITALARVVKQFPETQLVITGAFLQTTKDWQKLAEKLHIAKNVIWTGEVKNDDMGTLYEQACVYVYTAPEEDYGMGVVEAEEFGVPVVAWNHAGPTVTVVDLKTGLLARPYDINDFAKKIMWLLQHPEERVTMGKAAHAHVRKHFTWENHVSILEKALHAARETKNV